MKLTVIGSSSAGNGYILDAGDEALVLEAGVPFARVKEALNFNITKIAACLITHEHKDHSGHIEEVMASAVPCYCSAGTADAIRYKGRRRPGILKAATIYRFGSFMVQPFEAVHDAAEPFGYYIHHPQMGSEGQSLLFATDTAYLKHRFSGLQTVLIEANYSLEYLQEGTQTGRIPKQVRDRIIKSHMSIDHAVETLRNNDLSALHTVVLIHLSADNSNADEFRQRMETALHIPTAEVLVARPGLEVQINDLPF